jgi:hypothetical protein
MPRASSADAPRTVAAAAGQPKPGAAADRPEPVWITPAVACVITALCRDRLGARLAAVVSPDTCDGRVPLARVNRALAIDRERSAALRAALEQPRELWRRDPHVLLYRLAAEYLLAIRPATSLGRDTLLLGTFCALVFVRLNGADPTSNADGIVSLAVRIDHLSPHQIGCFLSHAR